MAVNTEPVVTVGIPTFDRPALLRKAIASVIAQSFGEWVAVVSDNGNRPTNREIVESFGDPRITYVAQESNLGIVGNFNYLLASARTPFCAILHDDDEYHPEYLARMVGGMRRFDAAGWAFCDALFGDTEFDDQIGNSATSTDGSAVLVSPGPRTVLSVFSEDLRVTCPTVMFRSDVAARERFDAAYPMTADLDMWVRLAGSYAAAHVQLPLLRWRWWEGNESHGAASSGQFLVDVIGIATRLRSDESLRAVRPQIDRVAQRRVRSLCRALLDSAGPGHKPADYAAARAALSGERSIVARTTSLVLGHRWLLGLMMASRILLRGVRRLIAATRRRRR